MKEKLKKHDRKVEIFFENQIEKGEVGGFVILIVQCNAFHLLQLATLIMLYHLKSMHGEKNSHNLLFNLQINDQNPKT